MSKDRPPSFPLYVRDLLTDPKVDLMTNEEFGAYFRLMCVAFLSDEIGYLRDDDAELAIHSRAFDRWPKIKARVKAPFDSDLQPGWLVQKRMVEERVDQSIRYRKAVAGGKKRWQDVTDQEREDHARIAAMARWAKGKDQP